jgi:hypothetical protein
MPDARPHYPHLRERVPEHTAGAIDAFIATGQPVGGFVNAVLTNDLFRAFDRADPENIAHMQDIVTYVYNEAPMGCYGNQETVDAWIRTQAGTVEAMA